MLKPADYLWEINYWNSETVYCETGWYWSFSNEDQEYKYGLWYDVK